MQFWILNTVNDEINCIHFGTGGNVLLILVHGGTNNKLLFVFHEAVTK